VPAWKEFRALLDSFDGVLPPEADVSATAVAADKALVTISTRTPGLIVGRRGTTASLIRDAPRSVVGPTTELRIEEVREPPEDPSSGIRQPRDPFPPTPKSSAQIAQPGGDEVLGK